MDREPELAQKFKVLSIPTLAVLKNGETIYRAICSCVSLSVSEPVLPVTLNVPKALISVFSPICYFRFVPLRQYYSVGFSGP